jgi:iron(III) transport system substrate-binding protein
LELTNPIWKGKAALAYPLFGTTATHAAVLYDVFGEKEATRFFENIRDNDILILDGNATVRDLVVAGEAWWGFTDTDDANAAIADGKNVGIVYPDQGEDEMGMLVIPNTVAMLRDCPNPENARKLIDFILRPEIEERLARARSAQIPVREAIPVPENVVNIEKVKVMEPNLYTVTDKIEPSARILNEIFIR